jgi:hypothetical protein
MGAASSLATTTPDVGIESARTPATQTRPARIGLFPAGERHTRARLFTALEQAYPVRFEGFASGEDTCWDGLDGLVSIGPECPAALPLETPCLHAVGEERPQDAPIAPIALAEDPALARPPRGARLTDRWAGSLPAQALTRGQLTLATAGGAPAWVVDGRPPGWEARDGADRELVAAAPAELEEGEALRERLAPGRCLALLALIHFLRRVTREERAEASPLRAAFLLDDPNLHWPSYGHVRYAALARHAREHGYHLAVAMAPLDGRLVHPRAARIFREHPEELSICVHGNDHLGPELGRIASAADGLALARQALGRAAAFQRRTGISFEPVMVPPHEQLSEPAAQGLLAGGFGAVCVSRPYPWIAPARPGAAAALGAGPPARGALAGWESREIVAGGLPVLLRAGFNAPREDLALRAFLGQPLILYGHHDLLAQGLDVLAQASAAIDALGAVRWESLAGIAGAGGDGPPAASFAPEGSLRGRPIPLLRRLASEARDRAQALKPAPR